MRVDARSERVRMTEMLRWVVAAASLGSAAGASESEPHYHDGKLIPYGIGPPAVLLSDADKAKLRSGKPVMQVLADEMGARRLVMVQDIAAPPQIVFGCGLCPQLGAHTAA